jgi:hypothetical protein
MANHAILRHMRTQKAPPEPVLAMDVRQFRLDGPQLESFRVASTWHAAHDVMATAHAVAIDMGITLNSFLLGTLAWVLHDVHEQRRFAISQTYLGRTAEELRAVGSYSVVAPMVFDFSEGPSLQAVCRHVQRETLQILALDVIVQSTQIPTVAYELNDLRPMKRLAEIKRRPTSIVLFDLFFIVNQHLDGYAATVLYDEGKRDAPWVDGCVERWMVLWQGVREWTFDEQFEMSVAT